MHRNTKIVLCLVVLGLVTSVTPAIGTASADVCRIGDVNCYERKVRCIVGDPEDPLEPRVCTA